MSDKLRKDPDIKTGSVIEGDTPEVGQWYWVDGEDHRGKPKRWLGCVVRLGSNYVKLEAAPGGGSARVHNDEFWDECIFEPNPDDYIDSKIQHYQDEVHRLMGRVKEVTARLAVAPSPELHSGDETQALAIRNAGDADMDTYKADLVKAKEDLLPDLFREIKDANSSLAEWMSAKVIPLQAQAADMQDVVKTIEDRIFSVTLYAGLTEQVVRVLDGDPAPLTTKIHLMQRRCYMDEECLARYEAGGMEFDDIGDFDAWLTRPENFDRLLPFPRTIVSFQVRREDKHRETVNLSDFLRIMDAKAADKLTFLYIRNGGQLFRMRTSLEFGEKLFPDMDKAQLDGGGQIWAKVDYGQIKGLISDNEYWGIQEEHKRKLKAWKIKQAAYEASLATPEAKAKAKAKGYSEPDGSCTNLPWPGSEPGAYSYHKYVPFNSDSVLYDDMVAKIADDIKQHNRIALILQGLLDRSPVLHPHPPWQLWSSDGFQAALRLVYDESRTLPAGPLPDFKAYRERLNRKLKTGSVTVGQDDAWTRHEAEKECRRLDDDYRNRSDYRPTRFRPYGNPGPGIVAAIAKFGKKSGKCSYAWQRDRQTAVYEGEDTTIRTTFTTVVGKVLNIDAYTPGDFHQFFDDPRTRAKYLQWAPLLLVAEDYHAGKREAAAIPPPKPKKTPSYEGQRRYQQRKVRKALMDKTVSLTRQIETKGGEVYEVGSRWAVIDGSGDEFYIQGVDEEGKLLHGDDYRAISGVRASSFEVVE
jgi:hypothetical protein